MFPPSSPILVQTKLGDDIWQFENWWTENLYNLCNNINTCCLGWWCCLCTMYRTFKRAEDSFSCCWPLTLWSLRTKIRTLFRIRGSVCDDCTVICFCPCCAVTQMDHELTQQGL